MKASKQLELMEGCAYKLIETLFMFDVISHRSFYSFNYYEYSRTQHNKWRQNEVVSNDNARGDVSGVRED